MKALMGISFVLVAVALCFVHAAPPAQVEAGGLAQKIFYFHVSSAWVSFLAFMVAAGYGIAHLISESGATGKTRTCAARCYSAVEVGFVFCSCVLVSGPIWAKPVWGVWWRWEPRLTTFLILWATYAVSLVLRASVDRAPVRDRILSVYAILAAAEIPVVLASVHFLRPESQFHPPTIELASEFLAPLWASMAALTALFFTLWQMRTKITLLEEQLP